MSPWGRKKRRRGRRAALGKRVEPATIRLGSFPKTPELPPLPPGAEEALLRAREEGLDWETSGFDDSLWSPATTYGTYGIAPWSTNAVGFPNPSTAEWIWSADNDADNEVFLRYTLTTP